MDRAVAWFRKHDPNGAALRRALRTAIVMPSLFALSLEVLHDPVMAPFAAFGSFALLLLADFSGPMRDRVTAQISLVVVGCVFVCVGSVLHRPVWLAVLAMLVVGFLVLFAGVVSSVTASATLAALLSFILPITFPGDMSTIPHRLAGWALAGGVSVLAIRFLWPAPVREPLRSASAEACRALAIRLSTRPTDDAEAERIIADSDRAVEALRSLFFATAYRPTGLSTEQRVIVRLVDEILWLDVIAARTAAGSVHLPEEVHQVKVAAGTLLDHASKVLAGGPEPQDSLQQHLEDLVRARLAMERAVTDSLPLYDRDVAEVLHPSFRAHELSFVVNEVGDNVAVAEAAGARTWWQRLLGREPAGAGRLASSAFDRAASHVEPHSVWLHNSVRGAIGLAAAVLIADVSGVQHSFWIVLGTLSVLRSSALSTGQNILRALGGTLVGLTVGGVLVFLIGTHTPVLWAVLPVAIVIAGVAPALSFAAGQAGFTVALLVLFNILAPAGWRIGIVRIEDVAIGFAVSLVVGALFWPRGAAAALAQSLGEAYGDAAGWLRASVAGAVHCTDSRRGPSTRPEAEQRTAASARRLDDALREFLAERGAKRLTLAETATMTTGVAGLRISTRAVNSLWSQDDTRPEQLDGARGVLMSDVNAVTSWFTTMARAVAAGGDVPEPQPDDQVDDARLASAVRAELPARPEDARRLAVRIAWTQYHLDAVRRLQGTLSPVAAKAARFAAAERHWPTWWSGRTSVPPPSDDEMAAGGGQVPAPA